MTTVACFAGLGVLIHRLRPRKPEAVEQPLVWPLVSIIVPCRDEEENLATVVASLKNLQYPSLEIIVVDDGSCDRTLELARSLGVIAIEAGPKPAQWAGKTWACWRGAVVARGDLLLFTDADTQHDSGSLARAVAFLESRRLDLLSAPPFHECRLWFDKWIGPFQLLPFLITSMQHEPSTKRVFAIGQYLLWRKSTYFQLGGHSAIKTHLAEDIEQARLCLYQGASYEVYPGASLYRVQMFSTPLSFAQGWTRLLRVGFKYSSVIALIELILVFHLFAIGFWELTIPRVLAFFAGVVFLAIQQRRFGDFSWAGAALAPLSMALFILLSAWGIVLTVSRSPIRWRGRSYQEAS